MPTYLDELDLKILTALQADGRVSNADLANRIGLSATPCLRRVRVLEEQGAIKGYRALLDRAKVGLGLTVMVGVKVDGHRDENARAIQAAFIEMSEVVACHLLSGETDFLLEVVVPDLAHYEQFLLGKLLLLPMVKDIRSNIVIRTMKETAPLPLDNEGRR